MLSEGDGSPASGPAAASWQAELKHAFRDGATLLDYLELTPRELAPSAAAEQSFPCLVPLAFARRMRKGDPTDPLLRQVLPQGAETISRPGYTSDPLREAALAEHNGVLQKYPGRALLLTTGACPVHCRYCFRRHFPYPAHRPGQGDGTDAIARLAELGPVKEVILSGGDPLTLSNRRLGTYLDRLASLEALQTIRIHTRFPIILPSRVDRGLVSRLARTAARIVVVLHVNHPNEVDAEVGAAMSHLRGAGVTLLNQAVLLRGVNDDAATLERLSETLGRVGVLPYYLHLLDPVAGAAHFDVPESVGVELIGTLRARLPGYLVPRLAREVPGEPGKSLRA